MAQEKATLDPVYKPLEDEAKKFVLNWFDMNHYLIDADSLYLNWLGLTKKGYQCMIGSTDFPNIFFTLKKNMITGEMFCSCLHRFEYIAQLPESNEIKRFIA